ncbi:27242_t:CDS:2 [Gigaspora margarita]|uniref:valine--tRNA ligase n=1 Tax=Gigaspora margarita TaxID=4874 RepID=A0ABM8VVF9_GIGMA|nr:27242_t:CDS:2 [Gigaspora margarita]
MGAAKNIPHNFTGTLLLPPPNITGNLHLGHAFESVIQDFLSKIEKLQLPELDTDEKKRNYTLQTCFTLDPIIQEQVREAFVKLYQDGFIYRGTNVISDIEVEHKPAQSKLYYLKYPLQNSNDYLLVATSRPETIFADVALFVNPNDPRYQKYLNQQIKHPWTGKIIPILADESIKIDFGSGVLKCTPAHDFTDYELGKKYQLSVISCTDEKGILNELVGQWQGQEISSIREEFVARLVEKGICAKIEEYETNLAYSSKSGAIIEPLLSQQWFLDLPALIKQVEKKQPNFLTKINFTTSQFRKTLEDGLWPLVSLAKEREKFPSLQPNCYPITTLITVPFQQVLLHGLIRDKYGKKMSKSLGNGVEPEVLIEKYGCDSLRLFLLENNVWGSDLIYNEDKVVGKLAILQRDFFYHLEKKEINFATTKLIKFAREKLSNEYLELSKISPWDASTKNTLLFVYQQLLIMLHPAIPFITEYLYQEITQREILNEKIERIETETKKNEL